MRAVERCQYHVHSVKIPKWESHAYRCYRYGCEGEGVADYVPYADALAAGAVLHSRVFHFPERWGV